MNSVAVPAGLEPATFGVEFRRSIQLNYGTIARVQNVPRFLMRDITA